MTALSDHPARSRVVAALQAAARAALHAPSVFNTQPWRWQITGETLELYADRDRTLQTTDPGGHLLMLSCGAALHHARVTLEADRWAVTVERLPHGNNTDLLARITATGIGSANPRAERLAEAIPSRRTDRRAFGDRTVPDNLLTELRRIVEAEGAYLHLVRHDQMPMLATSTSRAADAENNDPAYLAELQRWTNRPAGSGDGVPPATAVQQTARRVPVRDYAPGGTPGLATGDGFDLGAAYVVLFGRTDQPAELLRGGEALSALLLTATTEGLATAPLSDTIEVQWPRLLLRDLLAEVGEPYLIVRLGYSDTTAPLPEAPRREPHDVIQVDE